VRFLLSPIGGDEHQSKLDGSSLMEKRSTDPGDVCQGTFAGDRRREISGGRLREGVEAPALTEKGTFGRLLSF
jgi:hypothetical protein